MKLAIKNMVCSRCIMVVEQQLAAMDLTGFTVALGEANLKEQLSALQISNLARLLSAHGFELLVDKKQMIVEKVKNIVVQILHGSDQPALRINFSELIRQKLGIDYHYITSVFSSLEGITIEQYIIQQRIEKVKELLVYNELTLSEIAYRLEYSSVHHLSNQFKKITGLTPSVYKNQKGNLRKPLDLI